ncbi:MAG: DNA polymerase IV [Eubacteriales bacterium]
MLSDEAENYIRHKGINQGRVVLHSDLNNFFASVECLKHKALAAYPIAVCGNQEERHGIVLAKNNLAKAQGVKTGQVIWQAKHLCPKLIVLEPHYEEYLYYSQKIRKIYARYSDRVEPFGMDEAWLELTGVRGVFTLQDGVKTANRLRKEIYEETGLTVSVGVSDNKTFSKLASDYKKPDAVTVFGPGQYLSTVAGLPIGEMMFAGRSTQKRLHQFAVETIGDAAHKDLPFFRSVLGKNGENLYRCACGYDSSPVQSADAEDFIKSIGNSATAPRDIGGEQDVKIMIYALCDKVCARLRKAGLKATVLQLHVRDTELHVMERQCGVLPVNHAGLLAEQALALFKRSFPEQMVLRSLGVRTSGLISCSNAYQGSLFEMDYEQSRRTESLDQTVDTLRLRYGTHIIRRGVLCADKALYAPLYSEKHRIQPFKSH